MFLDAYNYARRLKTLCGLTPYEFVCNTWAEEPERFTRDPRRTTPWDRTAKAAAGYSKQVKEAESGRGDPGRRASMRRY